MDWIQQVIDNPIRTKSQPDGRIKKWAKIEEVNKFLRVILLEDGKRFIMYFLIEILKEGTHEDKIFSRYRYSVG